MLKFWIAAYALLLAAVIAGFWALRANVLAEMGTASAEADWKRWKTEAATQDGTTGPVQRAVPKSNQPPLYILMRDYFPASVLGLLLPLSALYWFIAWLVQGVARQSAKQTPIAPGDSR